MPNAAKDAIRQQIAKYTAALDAADIDLASQVWRTSAEVSFIRPQVTHAAGRGTAVQTDGRETQVYEKAGNGWQLVHVHYSGPAIVP